MGNVAAVLDEKILHGFRRAMRGMAATVTIITTREESGSRHGMAVTAVSSVTMDPPTLLICVNSSASLHSPILRSKSFCVNVLSTKHSQLVSTFSGKKEGEERFDEGDWQTEPETGIPFLGDAQTNIFCKSVSETLVGTHSIILGEVTSVLNEDAIDPLVYLNGSLLSICS